MNKNFTEVKHCYRVRVDQYSTQRVFISQESFKTYEEAWNYAKEQSKQFGACGFCVVGSEEPELNFGSINI